MSESRHRTIVCGKGDRVHDRRMWTVRTTVVAATLAVSMVAGGCSWIDHRGPVGAPRTAGTPGAVATPPATTDQTDCASRPSACGYPDETNTGVPAGTALTVHEGDLTIDTAGTVIDRMDIRGCVRIEAANVVIRRTKITCTGFWGILAFPDDHEGGLLLEDVEVDCANQGFTAIGYYGLVARRVNLHGCENGIDIDDDVVVEDSYIHDMFEDADAHADGVQFNGGANVVIRHNTIVIRGTSAIITGHGGPFDHVTIEGNLLGGGAYTLYCPDQPGSVDFRVIDNRFVPDAAYGPSTACATIDENRGNFWDDTLAPVEPQ
jgi:hypothetical protein